MLRTPDTTLSRSGRTAIVLPVFESGYSRASCGRERCHLRLCLRDGRPWRQASEHTKRSAGPIVEAPGERQRHPHFGARLPERREPELRRHDTDDDVRVAVELDGPRPTNCRIAAEAPLPQAVAQHDDALATRLIFAGDERSPARRRHAEQVEHVRGYLNPRDAFRALTTTEGCAPRLGRGKSFKGMGVATIVEVVSRRHRTAGGFSMQRDNEPIGLSIRQRSQEHRIDHRKDGCRCANPQGQRHDGEEGDAGLAPDHTQGKPRVTEKCFHSRLRRGRLGGGWPGLLLARNGDEHFYPTNYPIVVHAVGQLRLEIVDEVATLLCRQRAHRSREWRTGRFAPQEFRD